MQKLISIPDLFKQSFELYKARWWTMLLLGSLCWVVCIVVFTLFGVGGFVALLASRGNTTFSLLAGLLFLIGLLFVIIVTLWMHVALVYVIKEEYAKAGVKTVLKAVWNKLGSFYWISFLRGIIILAGFILFIIPGIIFSLWYVVASYTFVFDGAKGMQALSKSRELTKGYWWAIFGRMLLLSVIMIAISSLTHIGFLINSLFVMPFGIVYLYVIYEDLKRIKSV